ncbi:MAG: KH domain-containing protein [Candidatus Hydrogenedens sp.]|jgi:spoIIIJ-associated protein|nr:KH domain-containing protein [Candidatus Hydrogenedens sp.]
MKVIESSGQTREEAIQQGLDELGVAMDEVERIDVIDEGSKGFLGIGKRLVRVRITVDMADIKPRRNQSRRDNRNNDRNKDRQPRQQNRSQRKGPDSGSQRAGGDRPKRDDEQGDAPEERQSRRSKRQSQANRNQQEKNAEGRSSDKQNRRGRSGRRQSDQQGGRQKNRSQSGRQEREQKERGRKEGAETEKHASSLTEEGTEATRLAEQFENGEGWQEEIVVEPIPEGAREEEAIEPISDEQGNEMAATLKEMVDRMGLEASVNFVRDKEGGPCLAMKSENDSAILIGKHGITLNALQYLVNRMLTSGDNENTERLMVDVGEYVSRRRASLVDMAKKMARRAKDTGRNVKLKPLSPQERRIVHLSLQNDPDIRTFSQGDSLYRSIIINPVNVRRGGGSRPQRPQSRRRNQAQQNAAPQGD